MAMLACLQHFWLLARLGYWHCDSAGSIIDWCRICCEYRTGGVLAYKMAVTIYIPPREARSLLDRLRASVLLRPSRTSGAPPAPSRSWRLSRASAGARAPSPSAPRPVCLIIFRRWRSALQHLESNHLELFMQRQKGDADSQQHLISEWRVAKARAAARLTRPSCPA